MEKKMRMKERKEGEGERGRKAEGNAQRTDRGRLQ